MSPLFLLLSLLLFAPVKAINYLNHGDYLSVENPSKVLRSPSGTFTCGFYKISPTVYTFSIWFSKSANNTVVWTANRNQTVHNFGSIIKLRKDNLVLTDYDGSVAWNTNMSTGGAYQAELLDTGNLVVKSRGNSILWQSFDYPTNTLLPTQRITSDTNLIAFRAPLSSDYYQFFFDDNYVLSLKYGNPTLSSKYWPDPMYSVYGNGRVTSLSSRNASFDATGHFTSTDDLQFDASDLGLRVWRRLTLDPDGNLRLYSLNENDGSWSISWVALSQQCKIHGLCGKNGICMYALQPTCTCPPGYKKNNPSDWSEGCSPVVNSMAETKEWFAHLPGTDYWGSDINVTKRISIDQCKDICKAYNRSCKGLEYHPGNGDCYIKNFLFSGNYRPGFSGDMYLQIFQSSEASVLLPSKVHTHICNGAVKNISLPLLQHSAKGNTPWSYMYWFLLAFFVIELFFISFGYWFVFRQESNPLVKEEGYKLVANQFKRYTYRELEKATKKFQDVVGQGGSGVVYKGVLRDGRVAAMKKLDVVNQGEEEFQAELRVIGHIYHINLVTIWGFCSEKSHRILVTEYIENGSLDKALFETSSSSPLLGWKQRYRIAIGVAKGLAYLHHECLEWVIHCDVKPENILLDNNLEPKIADFGLAKLLNRNGANSKLSRIRGTRGYIAPEWATNLPITAKVDVYSYGVMLLELVMGLRVSDWVTDNVGGVNMALSFATMLEEKLAHDETSCTMEIADPRLNGDFNLAEVVVCVKLAVSCLEEEHSKRPSMDFVVQTLHGVETL
jgi:Protein kinase domain/D-mannose binding lectin/S-locus glycoprotein domain